MDKEKREQRKKEVLDDLIRRAKEARENPKTKEEIIENAVKVFEEKLKEKKHRY